MVYVGIDQSYTGFGLTLLNVEDHVPYVSVLGKFDAVKHGQGAQRLEAIQSWLYRHLSDFDLEHVCMEGYANGAKFGRESAGELGGAVKLALWSNWQITPTVVPPTSVKKFATGSGTAKKSEMLLNVYKRWGAEFSDDNKADSFVLAKIAEAIDKQPTDLPKFQAEVLSKLN